jgi:hypothetical protein
MAKGISAGLGPSVHSSVDSSLPPTTTRYEEAAFCDFDQIAQGARVEEDARAGHVSPVDGSLQPGIQKAGVTELRVDLDSNEEFEKMFEDLWPKALSRLKQICES